MSYMPPAKSDIHVTPDVVFDKIETIWGYQKYQLFDPCPLNPQWDGLNIEWKKINYINPPYTLLKEFVSKAISESDRGGISIMLLPSKTDQKWFHLLYGKYEIHFIQGRLKFKNNQYHATQPHFLVLIK
uniref:ORF28 n=1 Tax=Nitrosopumilaceae spindle-shaped virus TaxID=3065433 RepID=A0AAT9JAK8_9VIRU